MTEGRDHREIHILDAVSHDDPSVSLTQSAALPSQRLAPGIRIGSQLSAERVEEL